MARYMATGTSVSGAVSNSTVLFTLCAAGILPMRATIRRIVFGVEGATSFAQGPLEVGLYTLTAKGTTTSTLTPQAQDSSATVWPNPGGQPDIFTAWSVAPTLSPNPLIRRSFSVLSEGNWVMDMDSLTSITSSTSGFGVQTVGNANPTASALTVTWTVFLDVANLA